MSIESEADLQGLQRAGCVVALTLALRQDADGWTVRTRDGSLTAHAEHTVVVTRRGAPLVLTSGV